MKLTEISIKRPVFATMLILALVVLGLFSYMTLNVDEYPNVEVPVVAVTVLYPGASPEQVESKVTQEVEEAVNTMMNQAYRDAEALLLARFREVTLAALSQHVHQRLQERGGCLAEEMNASALAEICST